MIWTVVALISLHVVIKDDSLSIKNVFFGDLEVALCLREDEGLEHLLVILINHTISEDTLVLVEPELQDLNLVRDCLLMRTANALENLANITQVECVVRLVGRGLQLLLDTSVYYLGRVHKL